MVTEEVTGGVKKATKANFLSFWSMVSPASLVLMKLLAKGARKPRYASKGSIMITAAAAATNTAWMFCT